MNDGGGGGGDGGGGGGGGGAWHAEKLAGPDFHLPMQICMLRSQTPNVPRVIVHLRAD